MDETDVIHTAKLMVDEYGIAAESQAKFRADKAFLAGDLEVEETWKRVVAAIRAMRSPAA